MNISKAGLQIAALLGPLIFGVVAIHLIERFTQRRMTKYFGWKSNLWTGWLGAPIHEYSHAVIARAFGHQVRKIVPFQPEQQSGRLGYVELSYNPKSWWQTTGHFFVCYAPLLGGTISLFLLTLIFYPEAITAADQVSADGAVQNPLNQALRQIGQIVTPENFATARFWLFSYFVLCIGCHMAPSSVDYVSSKRAHFQVLPFFLVLLTIFLLLGGLPQSLYQLITPAFMILQANLIFATLLCLMVMSILYIITEMVKWLS